MSRLAEREWRLFLEDMIEFCEKVIAYTATIDLADFVRNDLVYDVTLRNL